MSESDRRFGGDVGRSRMTCRRCECGRRCECRVAQKVGVLQHGAWRGSVRRQAFVGHVLVWGREATGLKSVVCVGPVAWHLAASAFGFTLEVWAVVAGVELAFERVRLRVRLARTMCCVRVEQEVRLRAIICTPTLPVPHRSGRDDVESKR